MRRTILHDVKLALKGFCMGAADVVPGVSGGTMALVLGIYPELIASIRSFDLKFLKQLAAFRFKEAFDRVSWRFVLFLFIGILSAVFSLARIIGWLLSEHPVLIWSFFFGLVLASAFTVSRHLDHWRPSMAFVMLCGIAGAYWIVGLIPAVTPDAAWFLFLSGAVAICAMILPGISGSFILVLLGKYHYVLQAVNQRDIVVLAIVAAGALAGLVCFVRLLHWLLNKYGDLTLAVLTGFMIGSLRRVWPWKILENSLDSQGNVVGVFSVNILPSGTADTLPAVALMGIGLFLVIALEALSARKEKKTRCKAGHRNFLSSSR
ncbi:MAG: DUF368 domain-containing protein [Desulfobacterales bacterium]|nr:DUF368 domain-containing protein [Desulfobacterales bacterium]